jgi:hypothetical protein
VFVHLSKGDKDGRYGVIFGKGELGLMLTSAGAARLLIHLSDLIQ